MPLSPGEQEIARRVAFTPDERFADLAYDASAGNREELLREMSRGDLAPGALKLLQEQHQNLPPEVASTGAPGKFDLDGARKAGYSDREIAGFLAPQFNFDLEGAQRAGYSPTEIIDGLTASPKFTDYAKSLASGALSGTGMIFQGGGELFARGVNAVAPSAELRAVNPFQGAIDWLETSKSPAAHTAEAGTQITGSLFEPDTWSFGTNPTLSGLALQGVNAIGQFAPNLAIALGTAGASIPAQLSIGAVTGGLQALGGGAEEERSKFAQMGPDELQASSALYRALTERGVSHEVARDAVAEAAALGGGLGNAIPSAGEGAFENFIVGALTRGRLKIPGKGLIGKAAVGATGGAAMGGTEEALEQVGQNVGSNLAIGGNRPLTADTLQQFVMGAIAEGVAGAGGGAMSHVTMPKMGTNMPETGTPAVDNEIARVVNPAATVDKANTEYRSYINALDQAPNADAAVAAASAAVDAPIAPDEKIAAFVQAEQDAQTQRQADEEAAYRQRDERIASLNRQIEMLGKREAEQIAEGKAQAEIAATESAQADARDQVRGLVASNLQTAPDTAMARALAGAAGVNPDEAFAARGRDMLAKMEEYQRRTHAIQEPGTGAVDVRQQTENGEGVGGANAKPGATAAAPTATEAGNRQPEQALTDDEIARRMTASIPEKFTPAAPLPVPVAPVTIMGAKPEKLTTPELRVSAEAAAKPEQRQAAKVELDRRAQAYKQRGMLTPEHDSMFTAIAKLGGLNKQDVVSSWGVDPADVKGLNPIFGKPLLRTNSGLSIDGMAELLVQHGYLDQRDLQEFERKFDQELRGKPVMTPQGMERQAAATAEATASDQAAEVRTATLELTPEDLKASGYDKLSVPEQEQAQAIIDGLVEYARGKPYEALIDEIIERAIQQTEGRPYKEYAQAVIAQIKEVIKNAESTDNQSAQVVSGASSQGNEGAGAAAHPEGRVAAEPIRQVAGAELALTGQTAAEVKAQGAAAQREAAAKKQREAAPPPEEFTLAGSNRQADQAAAHGQQELVAPERQNVETSSEQTTERPYRDTQTKALQHLARETEDDAVLQAVEDELNTRAEEHARVREERLAKGRAEKAKPKEPSVLPESLRVKPANLKEETEAADAVEAALKEKGIKFSRSVWYSDLARQLGTSKQETALPQTWKSLIANLKGVKREEIEWTGINDWLDLQQGKVTRQQILDYLNENGVKVEDVTLGQEQNLSADMVSALVDIGKKPSTPEEWTALSLKFERTAQRYQSSPKYEVDKKMADRFFALANEAGLKAEGVNPETGSVTGEPKFASYQLPGGENYRELLLTLPVDQNAEAAGKDARLKELIAERDKIEATSRVANTPELRAERQRMLHNVNVRIDMLMKRTEPMQAFKSSHFDQPNILAHIRFNERTDAEGKRVLFIEELQSDWAQKGKRSGFAGDFESALTPEERELRDFNARSYQGAEYALNDAELARAADLQRRVGVSLIAKHERLNRGVPPAPFVGKTESWVALALKRMIRYAADNGFDRVAWTTGEQQAARYDLSKQVDAVEITKGADGTFLVGAFKDGKLVIDKDVPDANGVADLVGKDLAEKAKQQPQGAKRYSGLDLKIGGEGMRAFYDKIVPNVANDVVKKLGGGKVASVPISFDKEDASGFKFLDSIGHTFDSWNALPQAERSRIWKEKVEANAQPGFDITPQLKEHALAGMPLFSRGKNQRTITTQPDETYRAQTDQAEAILKDGGYSFKINPVSVDVAQNAAGRQEGNGRRDSFELAKKVSALFGKEVIPVTAKGDFAFDGFVMPGSPLSKYVFIDASADKPAHVILGHELSHHMEKDAPAVYKDLVQALTPMLDVEGYREARSTVGPSEDYIVKEMVGDLLGNNFNNPEFWTEVAKRSTAFGKIAATIRQWLANIVAKLKGMTGFQVEQFVSDVEEARKVLAAATVDYLRNRGNGVGGYEAKFTRATDQTDTAAFKKWFGDSKVVDAEGKPLVVYHGTDVDFTKFNSVNGEPIFFSPSPKVASDFAETRPDVFGEHVPAPVVYPVYLSVNHPWDYQKAEDVKALVSHLEKKYGNKFSTKTIAAFRSGDYEAIEGRSTFKAMRDLGFDGFYLNEGKQTTHGGIKNIAVFSPDQIKSSIGNRGTFDPNNPNILFSRSIADSRTTGDYKDTFAAKATDFMTNYFTSFDKIGWWQKTVGTPFNLALTNKEFAPFYDEGQAYINDISRYGNESADLAQDLLPRVEHFRDVLPAWLGGKSASQRGDVMAASKALYAGTLWGNGSPMEGRVWTDSELKSGRATDNGVSIPAFNPMSAKQIALYRQALAATSKSMDELAKSLIQRIARQADVGFDRGMSLEDVAVIVGQQLEDKLGAAQNAGNEALVKELQIAKGSVADIADKAKTLNEAGYFPATRFGKYALHVVKAGKQLYFGMYESKAQALVAKQKLKQEFPGAEIQNGIIPKEKYKLFQGLSLDALEAFSDYIVDAEGNTVAKDALVQGLLKAATAERSVMKRHIHRKGIPGYSEDVPRVLASFVVSSARAIASNYHAAEMLKLAQDIKAGDVSDYAAKLARYMLDPVEEAQGLRGFLFAQYLGGSIASGLVNMTQPWMVTAPWMSHYTSYADAVAKLGKASTENADSLTGKIGEAYRRAKREGIVTPQEIHQLRAETGGGLGARNLALRKLSFAWGSIFSLAEQFNRKATFLAAYRIADEMTNAERIEKGVEDPYTFAKRAVAATQFTYNKGNRPVVSRGAIGATVMTFKTFSISYLEMAHRLYKTDKKAFALLALTLLAAGGIEGLPFAEDLEDLVDTMGQWLGYATNSKKKVRQWAMTILGPDLSQVALRGVSGLSWMPVDISARMGMANLIPGTAALKPSEKNKTKDVVEMLGPAGQFLPLEGTMMGNALERLGKGDLGGAIKAAAPQAIQAAVKGGEMLETGKATDLKGRKITTVSPGEAVLKMAGLQPASVARESQRIGVIQQDEDLHARMKSEILEQWARGVADKDQAEVRAAREKMSEWNRTNPELRISVASQQVLQRLKEMRMTREQRVVKHAPKEMRGDVREALR